MHEHIRRVKMQNGKDLNTYRMNWLSNFAVGGLIFGVILIRPFSHFFSRLSAGVPYYYNPMNKLKVS